MKQTDQHNPPQRKERIPEQSPARSIRVMIATGNAVLAAELEAGIRRLGHEPVLAGGAGTPAHLMEVRPDIALVDLGSPVRPGASPAAGGHGKRQDIPVIFIAPPDDCGLAELAQGPMTYGFLVPPVSDRELGIALTFARNRFDTDQAARQSEGDLRKCRVHLDAMLARSSAEQKRSGSQLHRLLHYIELTERKLAADSLELELHSDREEPFAGEEGVITADPEMNVVLLNPAAAAMLGWSGDEASGRPVGEVFAVSDRDAAASLFPALETMARGGGSKGESRELVPVATKTGELLSVSAWFEPIFDTDNEIAGIVLTFRHADEDRKKEHDAIRSRQLESLNLKVRGVAHDFNNILSSVLANIQLARMGVPENSPGHERLNSAEDGILRARELSQQMLTYANGAGPHARTPDIAGLVRDAGTFAGRGSRSRFEFSLPADLWGAIPDEEVIRLVLNDLFLFLDGSQPEGGVIRITGGNVPQESVETTSLKTGEYVRISLHAPGLVIPTDALPDLFRPGSALAFAVDLSLAESMVRKSGGILDVKSDQEAGTRAMLYLPALRGPAPARAQDEMKVPGVQKDSGAGRILLMDDEEAILSATSEMLRFLGYEVETAPDGETAVDLYLKGRAAKNPFDAVILDITVPGGLGAQETLPKLAAVDPGVRAIISSGYSTSPLITDYLSFGFAAAIVKPYGFLELQDALGRVFP